MWDLESNIPHRRCRISIGSLPPQMKKCMIRDVNSGTGIGYPLGTRPDGDGHKFLLVGGTRTRPEPRRVRVWAWVFFHPWVTHKVPKIKCVSILGSTGQPIYIPPESAGQPIKKEYFWKVLEIDLILIIVGGSILS
jgi:hypothetical protein